MWDDLDFEPEAGPDAASRLRVQTKKRVAAAPEDPLEREADQLAESIVRKPEGCECALGGRCKKCEEKLHRKAASPALGEIEVPAAASAGIEQMRGRGEALPVEWRNQFERSLGVDLGGTRIHTGPMARSLASTLDALAFTTGSDVFLGRDSIPATGDPLLAHELVHVAQQAGDELVLRQDKADADPDTAEPDAAEPDQDKEPAPGPEEGPPPPRYGAPEKPVLPEGAKTIEFHDYTLTADAAFLRSVLLDLVAREGTSAAVELVYSLQRSYRIKTGYFQGTPEQIAEWQKDPKIAADMSETFARKEVSEVLTPAWEKIEKEQTEFIVGFERKLRNTATAMLDDSEARVAGELARYNISVETVQTGEIPASDCADQGQGSCGQGIDEAQYFETVYDMPTEGTAAVNLGAAAKILLRRREVIDGLQTERKEHCHNIYGGDTASAPGVPREECDDQAEAIDEQLGKAYDDYNKLHGYFSQRFPILAGIGSVGVDKSKLAQIGEGPSAATAQVIAEEAFAHLKDIETTRKGLEPGGEGDVWALERLLPAASAADGVGEGSMQARWIQEKVKEHAVSEIFKTAALAALGLAFSLLAPATGGLSLIGSAAIGVYQAYESYQKYVFESAAANTDFDQARTIAAADPSMFWLALDIIGAIADVGELAGAALKAAKAARMMKTQKLFDAVAPEVRAAQAGEAITEEVEEGIRAAVKRGGGSEGLASRLIAKLKSGVDEAEELKSALNLSPEEAASLFDEAGVWRSGVDQADIVTASGARVGNVHITQNGWLWVCASPCSVLRDKYSHLLGLKDPEFQELATRLGALEKRAADAAISGDPEELVDVARQASYLDAELRSYHTAATAAHLDEMADLIALFPDLSSIGSDGLDRVLSQGANKWYIKGQLHEELLGLKLAESASEVEKFVPADVVTELAEGGFKLEYIPGYAVRDADQKMLTDGIIGYWNEGEFNIVTFFEAKAGRASSRGLRRKFTGFTRLEMDELVTMAEQEGMAAVRASDSSAGDLLDNAIEEFALGNWEKATGQSVAEFEQKNASKIAKLTQEEIGNGKLADAARLEAIRTVMGDRLGSFVSTDELLGRYAKQIRREVGRHTQTEAGQVLKTGERLSTDRLQLFGQEVPVTTHTGGPPHAVGVLPSDIPDSSLGDIMAQGGIKSYQTLNLDMSDQELDWLADDIVKFLEDNKP